MFNDRIFVPVIQRSGYSPCKYRLKTRSVWCSSLRPGTKLLFTYSAWSKRTKNSFRHFFNQNSVNQSRHRHCFCYLLKILKQHISTIVLKKAIKTDKNFAGLKTCSHPQKNNCRNYDKQWKKIFQTLQKCKKTATFFQTNLSMVLHATNFHREKKKQTRIKKQNKVQDFFAELYCRNNS